MCADAASSPATALVCSGRALYVVQEHELLDKPSQQHVQKLHLVFSMLAEDKYINSRL